MTSITLDKVWIFEILLSIWTIELQSMVLPNSSPAFNPVENCPGNKTAVQDASQRLNCSYGVFVSKNEYHCVPISDFSQLVEFCLDQSGLIQSGVCMVLDGNGLNSLPCSQFIKGCPNVSYPSEEMYKFPACTRIDRYRKCYLEDANCQMSTRQPVTNIQDGNFTFNMDSTTSQDIFLQVFLPLLALAMLAAIVFSIYLICNRKSNPTQVGSEEEGIQLLPRNEQSGNLGKPGTTKTLVDDFKEKVKEDEFQKRFKRHIQEGYEEVCPISQIIIVGENGVGKTTLLYRLQGRTEEEIEKITSTRGVEFHVRKDSFIVNAGNLEINQEGISGLTLDPDKLINELLSEKPEGKQESHAKQAENEQSEEKKQESPTDKSVKETVPGGEKQDESIELTEPDEEIKDENIGLTEQDEEMIEMKTEVTKKATPVTEEIKNLANFSEDKVEKDILPFIHRKLKEKESILAQLGNKNNIVLDVLDFAGQGAYYASHQTFIRKDAIYIIVVDTSRSIEERCGENKEEGSSKNESVDLCDRLGTFFSNWCQKDYVKYWLNTIKIHGGGFETIIFAGTHRQKDSLPSDFSKLYYECAKGKNWLETNLELKYMDKEDKDRLKEIKTYISEAVSKAKEKTPLKIPAKWIRYGYILEALKDDTPVLSTIEILKIIDRLNFEIGDIEIGDMLEFFHRRGKILYFSVEKLREIVILDVPWFVKCFKHIVSDPKHLREDHRKVISKDDKKWKWYLENGFLEDDLYQTLIREKNPSLNIEHQRILGEYQNKLGMMFHIDNFEIENENLSGWYVPCVNTELFSAKAKKKLKTDREASPILCFLFEQYLPYDLFGRLIVKCLSTTHWTPYGGHLYKTCAYMRYGAEQEKGVQVYLFTSEKVITVQIIGRREDSTKYRQAIITELDSFLEQFLKTFYTSLTKYKIGYLCNNENGYEKTSHEHCITEKNYAYCKSCTGVFETEMEKAKAFWEHDSEKESEVESPGSSETQLITRCCRVYMEVLYKFSDHLKPEKRTNEGFGTFFINMLKNQMPYNCSPQWEILPDLSEHNIEADMKRLDRLIEVGQRLKKMQEVVHSKHIQHEKEIEHIAEDLKKIYLTLRGEHENIRRDMFFLWTGDEDKDTLEKLKDIPLISLKVNDVEYGTKVIVEASVDVDISFVMWLKGIGPNGQFIILEDTPNKTVIKRTRNMLSIQIQSFSEDDEGFYQLIVASENAVGKEGFMLSTDKDRRLPLKNIKCKKHPRIPLDQFCIPCGVPLCVECTRSEDHSRHQLTNIETLLEEIHRKDGDTLLMCLLLLNCYKINMKDGNWMTIYNIVANCFHSKEITNPFSLKHLEKCKPILKYNESEIRFSNEFFKDISFLKFSKNSTFNDIFLAWAEKENVAEYCRSWNYRRKEDEVCCWIMPEKTWQFIERIGEDIFTHPSMEDQSIHEAVFRKFGLPMQIILRGDKSVTNFIENLKKGKTTMYHASGMIIGCAGSGKTTLLERLKGIDLKEIKKNVSSTRGVDIQADLFDVTDSIQVNSSNQQQRFKLGVDKTGLKKSVPGHRSMNTTDDGETQESIEKFNDYSTNEVSKSVNIYVETKFTSTSSYDQQESTSTEQDVMSERKDFPHSSEVSGNSQMETKKISEDPEKRITMIDFAGACSYYASHQIFLSTRAFFILVLNMEKKFDDKIGGEVCCQEGSVYEGWTHRDYLEFWMNSIHQYSGDTAPVILVGTHSENKTEKEIMTFFHEIWATLEMKGNILHKHLHEDRQFAVGFHDNESIENIKLSIVKVVQNLNHWGEKLPCSWVMFEKFFQEKKSLRIMKKEMLLAFNEALPHEMKLQTVHDIDFMLQFFHDNREILYFNQEILDGVIILDVQWFANLFKNVITDKNHAEKDLCRFASDWKKFDQTGELNDTLLTAIWEMKGIAFSEHKTNVMLYTEKLGLLAKLDDKKWYVPCMNKKPFPAECFSSYPASSILCYVFDVLPVGIFHRLVATCLQIPWEIVTERGDLCIYQTAAVFLFKGQNVLLAMTPREIQLQIFVIEGEVDISKCQEIKAKIDRMLNVLSRTFQTDFRFNFGFKCKPTGFCDSQESSVINESKFTKVSFQCPSCPIGRKHIINSKNITKYWIQVHDDEAQPSEDKGINKGSLSGSSGSSQSHSKDNFAKIFKLLQVGTDAIRICFDKFFPKESLEKTLKENETDIRRGQFRFQPPQLEILFPKQGGSHTGVSSLSMDVTIMYKLLRNFSDITPPGNGWGKEPKIVDITESDDIERIRIYRNKYSHYPGISPVMSGGVFNIIWDDLSKAILRLSGGVLKRRISEI